MNTFNISNAENIQELPDVCFGVGNYVAVWTDLRNSIDRLITAARVTPQWVVLDTGIVVGPNSAYQITPVIAFDGSRFLVAWQSLAAPFGVHCRFLGGDGQPQDSVMTISSSVTASNPRIVFGGSKYLIVWQEYTTTNQIVGQFVSPGGILLGDEIVITSGTANHVSPAVCYDGNKYLVAWSQSQIWGLFLNDAGSPIGAALPISMTMNDQADPDVFFGGDKFLAVWSELRTDYDIYGNLDTQVSVLETYCDCPSVSVYPDKTIFTDIMRIVGGDGKRASIYNALGETIDVVHNGMWNAGSMPTGIYFVIVENTHIFRVVKIK
jgi:hypothetical protein